jgi:glycosyltransferase involved in cell wall biosynthesis
MKILILTNKMPYPPIDGGSIATMNMLTGLQRAGMQITCLALNTNKHKFPVRDIPVSLSKNIRFIGINCDTAIRPLRLLANLLFSREAYIAQRFRIQAFKEKLRGLLESEVFDMIQLEGPYPGLYLDLIRKLSRARITLRAHNVEHLIWERKALNERSHVKRWYLDNMAGRLKRFELGLAGRVDILVPISDPDASYFREKDIQVPSFTVPAGLCMHEYPLTPLPDEESIFFIGALDWLPNQEGLNWFLQKVFGLLLVERPEIKFHVAGRNAPADFEGKLQHPNIIFHGEVENAREFIQSHLIMVAPLLSGSGMRIKILEGMALGRPVLTTSAGIEGIPAVNKQHVLVEDDPELFASQLQRLLAQREEARAMVKEARRFIEGHFDTFELTRRLSHFYITGE